MLLHKLDTQCLFAGSDYPVLIIRPLLGLPKSQLEEACREAGLTWSDDPTNKDTAFLRNHLRALIARSSVPRQAAASPITALGPKPQELASHTQTDEQRPASFGLLLEPSSAAQSAPGECSMAEALGTKESFQEQPCPIKHQQPNTAHACLQDQPNAAHLTLTQHPSTAQLQLQEQPSTAGVTLQQQPSTAQASLQEQPSAAGVQLQQQSSPAQVTQEQLLQSEPDTTSAVLQCQQPSTAQGTLQQQPTRAKVIQQQQQHQQQQSEPDITSAILQVQQRCAAAHEAVSAEANSLLQISLQQDSTAVKASDTGGGNAPEQRCCLAVQPFAKAQPVVALHALSAMLQVSSICWCCSTVSCR